MKLRTLVYLFIIFVYFFFSFNQYKDEKVHLGGDNVAYYLLAKNLSQGNGYVDNHVVSERNGEIIKSVPHTHFPPGYPALLSVFMKFFGSEINVAKNVNGFFLLLSSITLFFLLQAIKINENIAFISSLFLLGNYYMLYFSMYLYSEVAFMLFLLLFLYSFIKQMEHQFFWKSPYFYVSLGSMMVMFYIKSIAVAAIFAMLLFLLSKKEWKRILVYVGSFVLFYLPWSWRMKDLAHTSYLHYLTYKNPYNRELGVMEFSDYITRILMNFKRYIAVEIPGGILSNDPLYNYKEDPGMMSYVVGVGIVLVVLFGLFKLKKYSGYLFLSLGGVFTVLLLWPEVWFGKRFILPIMPVLLGLFFWGIYHLVMVFVKLLKLYKIKKGIEKYGVYLLLLFFIPGKIGFHELKKNVDANHIPKYHNYFQAAKWVKLNTPDTSVTACRKPNLFHLYSGKTVTNYRKSSDKEEVLDGLIKLKVDYVILESLGFSSTSKYLMPTIQKYPGKFKMEYKTGKPESYVFQFLPEMGYDGEWKGDKKHGKGKYKYWDGSSYEGEWKENIREGKGEYLWKSNNRFVGEWKNDLREGQGVLFLSNGNIIKTTWVKDKMEGKGEVFNVKTKERTFGLFKNNKFIPNV
ncbi:MAG: glycosyltransferase family 39 protein [Flavobacteriales bacterium]|jgi:hypothetical protein|nr:glycosyltransferase family 39 protein [Flavobacteriales bacterium]